jgi:hypothetical protein
VRAHGTIRGELLTAIKDLHSRRERGLLPPFRRLVVESSGLADPFPILSTVQSDPVLRHHFCLGNAPAESSTETVARALAALTPSDLLRLKRVAQLRARLIPGLEWDELLNEALLRALDGSRRWPEGVPLLALGHGPPRDDRGYVFAILTLILRTLGCAKC